MFNENQDAKAFAQQLMTNTMSGLGQPSPQQKEFENTINGVKVVQNLKEKVVHDSEEYRHVDILPNEENANLISKGSQLVIVLGPEDRFHNEALAASMFKGLEIHNDTNAARLMFKEEDFPSDKTVLTEESTED
jgi:hypothetical protein